MHRHRGQAELIVIGVRHVLAGRASRPAYVQRASPTEPIVEVDLSLLDPERMRAEDLVVEKLDEALEAVERRDRGLEQVYVLITLTCIVFGTGSRGWCPCRDCSRVDDVVALRASSIAAASSMPPGGR